MKYLLLMLLCICFFFTSCKKFLDKKASTGITVPVTVSDLQALLDNSISMNQRRTPSVGEASADDYFISGAAFDNQNEYMRALYEWVRYDAYNFPNDWSDNYLPVYNANYCLEQIEKAGTSANEAKAWNNVKGSALFFRGYYFLQLVWTFSNAYDPETAQKDLGIALRLTADFNAPSSRATVQETYDQIIKDTKTAVELLPELPTHVFRPSKAAAYGLLARTYLSMAAYDSAAYFADLCLAIKKDLIDFNGDDQINSDLSGSTSPFTPFNKETIFYTECGLNASALISPYTARIDTMLYNSYAENDLRKLAYFIKASDGYYKFKGFYSMIPWLFSGIATDEMYLILAECYARSGATTKALEALNTLLEKRYNHSFTPYRDTANLKDLILDERRKELVMRGLRFTDIKRLNREGGNIALERNINGRIVQLNPNDTRYALPLPRDILQQTGMPQNP